MGRSSSLQHREQAKAAIQRQHSEITSTFAQRLPRKALRALFLRNMDEHFGGVTLPVSQKLHKLFRTLLEAVTEALRHRVLLKSAVTRVYRIDGTPIKDLVDFFEGDIVVCCCNYEPFVDVGYNVKKSHMRMLGSLIRRNEKFNEPEDLVVNQDDTESSASDLPKAISLYINVSKQIFQSQWTTIFEGSGRANKDMLYIIKMVDREHMCFRTNHSYFEIEILRQLQDHPNIIDLVYTVEQPKYIYIVTERLDCDLHELLQNFGPLSESMVKCIMRDLLCGLEYVHACQIIHRDLKLENVLVKLNAGMDDIANVAGVKIADFGLATYYKGRHLYQWCGTPHYMAPEIITYAGYDFFVDSWSLGVSLYYLLCLQLPFGNNCNKKTEIFEFIMKTDHQIPATYKRSLSATAQHLINSLLVKSPQCRLSATEARNHPFLQ